MNISCEQLEKEIFRIDSPQDFNALALEIFHIQREYNPVYRSFIEHLGRDYSSIKSWEEIPCMPMRFFKSHRVATGLFEEAVTFTSSGTTGAMTSKHPVKSLELYEQSFRIAFEREFGPAEDWCVLALLPGYLERKGSLLIYMVNRLIEISAYEESGFYLDEFERLESTLLELEQRKVPTLLVGVSFALLDFIESRNLKLNYVSIMETGGMKGRRKEIIREELHRLLKTGFGVDRVFSEYGMTELLSQAYYKDEAGFRCPPWMKFQLRDQSDPLTVGVKSGLINVYDLANLYSCSFLETDDIGTFKAAETLDVLGRRDHSDVRGCSLLYF